MLDACTEYGGLQLGGRNDECSRCLSMLRCAAVSVSIRSVAESAKERERARAIELCPTMTMAMRTHFQWPFAVYVVCDSRFLCSFRCAVMANLFCAAATAGPVPRWLHFGIFLFTSSSLLPFSGCNKCIGERARARLHGTCFDAVLLSFFLCPLYAKPSARHACIVLYFMLHRSCTTGTSYKQAQSVCARVYQHESRRGPGRAFQVKSFARGVISLTD